MPQKISCPTCNKTLNVSSKLAGKSGTCPKCGTKINFTSKPKEAWVELDPEDSIGGKIPLPKKKRSQSKQRPDTKKPVSQNPARPARQKPKPAQPAAKKSPVAKKAQPAPNKARRSQQPVPPRKATPPVRSAKPATAPVQAPKSKGRSFWGLAIGLLIGLSVAAWFAFPKQRDELVTQVTQLVQGKTSAPLDEPMKSDDVPDQNQPKEIESDGSKGFGLEGNPPPVEEPVEESQHANFAFLVGVKNYQHDDLPDLKYTENDVLKLATVLEKRGYKKENIIVLSDSNGSRDAGLVPTRKNIEDRYFELIEKLQAEASETESTVLVGFSGHGLQFKGDDSNFFCPTDCQVANKSTLVNLKDIFEGLEACSAKHKILLVDACRDDPSLAIGKNVGGQVELETISTRKPAALQGKNTTALFSCSAGQQSFETEALQHGVFFHFVINGLKGSADVSTSDTKANGEITANELAIYVTSKVRNYVSAMHRQVQAPHFKTNSDKEFVLSRIPSFQTKLVDKKVAVYRPVESEKSDDASRQIVRIEQMIDQFTRKIISAHPVPRDSSGEKIDYLGEEYFVDSIGRTELEKEVNKICHAEIRTKVLDAKNYQQETKFWNLVLSKMNSDDSPLSLVSIVSNVAREDLELIVQKRIYALFRPFWIERVKVQKERFKTVADIGLNRHINARIEFCSQMEALTEEFLRKQPPKGNDASELYQDNLKEIMSAHESEWVENFKEISKLVNQYAKQSGAKERTAFERLMLFGDFSKSKKYTDDKLAEYLAEYEAFLDFRRVYDQAAKKFAQSENNYRSYRLAVIRRDLLVKWVEDSHPTREELNKFINNNPYYRAYLKDFQLTKEAQKLLEGLDSSTFADIANARMKPEIRHINNHEQAIVEKLIDKSKGFRFEQYGLIKQTVESYEKDLGMLKGATVDAAEKRLLKETYTNAANQLRSEGFRILRRKFGLLSLQKLVQYRLDQTRYNDRDYQFALSGKLKDKFDQNPNVNLGYQIVGSYQRDLPLVTHSNPELAKHYTEARKYYDKVLKKYYSKNQASQPSDTGFVTTNPLPSDVQGGSPSNVTQGSVWPAGNPAGNPVTVGGGTYIPGQGQLPGGQPVQVQQGQVQSGQMQPGQVQQGQVQSGQMQPGQLQQGQIQPGQMQQGQTFPGQLPGGNVQPWNGNPQELQQQGQMQNQNMINQQLQNQQHMQQQDLLNRNNDFSRRLRGLLRGR